MQSLVKVTEMNYLYTLYTTVGYNVETLLATSAHDDKVLVWMTYDLLA